MRAIATLLTILGSIVAVEPALAQSPGQQLPPRPQPAVQMPPLMYVKLTGPKGTQATFYRGSTTPQTFDLPCTIGVRPGYCCRFALSGIPGFGNETFFGSLEVQGSLMLANGLRNADFPAAIVFVDDDFAKVRSDTALKKIIVLERPETAIPKSSKADDPLEVNVPPSRDPMVEARGRGAPLLVFHMGERKFSAEELAAETVPGSVLLPSEKGLGTPVQGPCLPWNCFRVSDPILGPINPAELYAIPDGGDVGVRAGVTRNGKIVGLDPSDTVASFADSQGTQRLVCSNRVHLCVPRFIVVTAEIAPLTQVALFGVGDTHVFKAQALLNGRQPIIEQTQRQMLEVFGGRNRASGTIQTMGTAITGRVNGVDIRGTVNGPQGVEAQCPKLGPEVPEGCLLVNKWPDKCGGLVGDIVTFTLRYTNTGGRSISTVVLTDSLTNRLEYVPGTAKSDRDAVFTTQANDAGSLVLRWEFSGSLLPRESGIVTFQVKIR